MSVMGGVKQNRGSKRKRMKKDIVESMLALYLRGLVSSLSGNIGARTPKIEILLDYSYRLSEICSEERRFLSRWTLTIEL